MRVASVISVLVPILASPAFAAPASKKDAKKETAVAADARAGVLEALAAEIDRARGLKLGENEPPFFVGLQLKETDSREISGRFGALQERSERRFRSLHADVRVGSYELDSTPEPDALAFDFDDDSGYTAPRDMPLDGGDRALRRAVWLVVDDQYKKALASYLKKRGKQVYRPDDPERAPSFSREEPPRFVEPPVAFPFDTEAWSAEVRRVGARFTDRPGVFDSQVRASADHVTRWFVSSEGARLVTESVVYALHVWAYARADDGMLLQQSRDYYGATPGELPRGEALDKAVDSLLAELEALRRAPVVDPFTGPALLAPEATGVLFHEAVGHRLEGERQDDENEGRTFRGQVGREVLSPLATLVDDPTQRTAQLDGRPVALNGWYRYDEQGVAAQPVLLVENGILRSYLMSRRPVKGFTHSNGHGRSAGSRMPVARMANLLVKPARTVPEADLKKMLVDEARRQGKPWGIYIKDIAGGNTNTATYGYQAFKGTARLVYRIYAADGREELVRGVEIVGTPLSSINKILAMGDRSAVFNGYCGAESGYVPVSTVAPAMLVGEMELQRTRKDTGRPPVLAPP